MLDKTTNEMSDKIGIAGELIPFMWHRNVWWMMPIFYVRNAIRGPYRVSGNRGDYGLARRRCNPLGLSLL